MACVGILSNLIKVTKDDSSINVILARKSWNLWTWFYSVRKLNQDMNQETWK